MGEHTPHLLGFNAQYGVEYHLNFPGLPLSWQDKKDQILGKLKRRNKELGGRRFMKLTCTAFDSLFFISPERRGVSMAK